MGDFLDEAEDLVRVLCNRGYRLVDVDADIAGEYVDIKAYYGCRLIPLDE